MPVPGEELRDELERWARQRLTAGETVRWRTAAAAASPAATPQPEAPPPAPARRASGPEPAAAQLAPATAPATAAAPAARMQPQPGDSLERIAAEIAACTRCRLHATRTRSVPGVGAADADLVFVGEGPGADEDLRGEPFVGRAGQLLTKIIGAIQLSREEVFITNIVKCRPPGNRDPEPDEIAACEPYLIRQLALLQPKVICALGRHAGAQLTGTAAPMTALRRGEHYYRGLRVFPTYHPAACLRNPQWKRPVWEDIQNVRREYDRARENS
jgi:DNA polymerase